MSQSNTLLPILDAPAAARPTSLTTRRFDRLARLYGERSLAVLSEARVAVFGLGGVGGFAAEALCRSAIGHLTLVDFDDVCVTNTNRQLQAMDGALGKSKAELLGERLRRVNPEAEIDVRVAFYDAESAASLLTPSSPGRREGFDFVVDCIDNLTAKAHLIATCRRLDVPIVSSMGAGGKLDPTRVRIADLARTDVCRLAHQLRKMLRQKHAFPRGDKKMGVAAVFSDELRRWPRQLACDGGEPVRCVCPKKSDKHSCNTRHLIDGTAAFVTGTFGLACAAHVINTLCAGLADDAPPAPARNTARRT